MLRLFALGGPRIQYHMLALQVIASVAALFDPVVAKTRVGDVLDQIYPKLEAVYRDLHAHPELGFEERRTADLLARRTRLLGFDVTEKTAKTGPVAIYRNGPGPTVLVRTELDALPMRKLTGLTYASRARGPIAPIPEPAIRTGVTAMTLAALN